MSGPPVHEGQILTGSLFNEPMRVETVQANTPASWVVGLVGTQSERFRKVTLTADELKQLTIVDGRHSFDGNGRLLRLGLQAHARGFRVGCIHGGMKSGSRDEPDTRLHAEQQFREGEIQVLVATEAAGEGINRQVCNILFNYDTPWNPNRLEQRMGRIHRYGQRKE